MLAVFLAFATVVRTTKKPITEDMQTEVVDAVSTLYLTKLMRAIPDAPLEIIRDLHSDLKIREVIDVVPEHKQIAKPNCFIDYVDVINILKTNIAVAVDVGCIVFKDDRFVLMNGRETFTTKSRTKLKERLFDNKEFVTLLVLE